MKKLWMFTAALAVIGLNACKNKNEFVINGKMSNVGDAKKVYLFVADSLGQMLPVDSTFLNEDHEFKLKSKSVEPEFCQLLIGQKSFLIIAENGDEITLKADLSQSSGAYELSGSEESNQITAYNKITSEFSQKTGALAEQYSKMISENAGKKDSIINVFNQKSQELAKPFLEKSYQFIEDHPKTLTAFYAANVMLGMDNNGTYENKLISYSKEAKATFPKNKAVIQFANQMEKAERIAIGQMAPDISAQTPDGKTLKLSDFKGKYVLLDFWASWCGPCRQESPNLVKQYQAFKDKKFTIFSFSLDDNKEEWMDAIQKDHLDWSHVSELKQWDAPTAVEYNITAIPASFIINPEGRIIAKNLRGEDLHRFLATTLK
ncbi:MAG: AhpC/TSA family protein [Sphingobacteriales bacterium]|nr:AhpC/TSA family protein [Sphingobacteriales bacterium]